MVSYTGVIPLDLTIDPDDPRFQGFSVGYGTDWDGAEADARADARFDTYYDGSGYEVIVREQWNVGAVRGAGGVAREEPRAAAPVAEAAGGSGRRPGDVFRDCAACPEMVVVPAGSFMMGSPASEEGRFDGEGPQHRVTIGSPFAVGVYEVTFAEWDGCVRAGGCGGYRPEDRGLVGPWEPAGDQRELGGCAGVCAVAVAGNGGASTGCSARRSGSMWRGRGRRRRDTGGRASRGSAGMGMGMMQHAERIFHACSDGYEYTAPVGLVPAERVWAVRRAGQRRGSGRRTVGTTTIRVLRLTAALGGREIVPVVCCAAAPGATSPRYLRSADRFGNSGPGIRSFSSSDSGSPGP